MQSIYSRSSVFLQNRNLLQCTFQLAKVIQCMKLRTRFLYQKRLTPEEERLGLPRISRQVSHWSNMDSSSGEESKQSVQPVCLSHDNIKDFVSKYDNFLLDCDGVLWAVDHFTPIPGISNAVSKLRSMGKRLLFVTNNSMGSRASYVEKFPGIAGFEAEKQDVFSVSYSAAVYLKDIACLKGKCYLVGGKRLAEELEEYGIDYTGYGPDPDPISSDPAVLMRQTLDPQVEAVLIGFDEYFSYNKLFKAASYLSNDGCVYVACNDLEKGMKLAPGYRQPVTGALVAAVTAAANRQPVVVGKPHRHLLDCILAKYPDMDLSRTVMIGDSVKTDIAFARNCGIASLLVLTGSSNLKDVEDAIRKQEDNLHVPDFYMKAFSDFGNYL